MDTCFLHRRAHFARGRLGGVLALFIAGACSTENPRFTGVTHDKLGDATAAGADGVSAVADASALADGIPIFPSEDRRPPSDAEVPVPIDARDASSPVDALPPIRPGDGSVKSDGSTSDVPAMSPDATADMVVARDMPDAIAMPDVVVPSPVNLNSGLLGYWRFDEPDGTTFVQDSSGRGHQGSFEGTLTGIRRVPGRLGRALEIGDASRDFGIRIDASAAIKNMKHYTVAAWVFRPGTRADHCTIISRQLNSTDAEVFNLSIAFDTPTAYAPDRVATGEVTVARSRTNAPLNTWFHLAATFDGATLALYQNGVLAHAVPYAMPLPATETPFYLATNKNTGLAQPFFGSMDEVLLYDVPLSAESVAALARGDRPAVP